MRIYNTNFTGSRVVIPDLKIRLEPGGEVVIDKSVLDNSEDLQKLINAKLVTVKYDTSDNAVNTVKPAYDAAIKPKIVQKPLSIPEQIPKLNQVNNIRIAIFIKEES